MIWRPGLGHLHHRQDRLQQRDQDDAGDRAEIAAAAAEDRGAAEHHGGDGRQQIGIAHRLRRLATHSRRAARRRRPSRPPESAKRDHHHAPRVDAGEVGRALAVADARRSTRPKVVRRQQEDRAPRRPAPRRARAFGMPRMLTPVARQRIARRGASPAARSRRCSTTISPCAHGVDAERDDHRRDAQIGDADAVDEADQRRRRGCRTGSPAPRRAGPQPAAAQAIMAPDRHHPGHRQVDLAEQDDQHHARWR